MIFISSRNPKKTAACAAVLLLPLTHCQPTLESCSGLESGNPVEFQFPDALTGYALSMLALQSGQDQPGRIATVEASKAGLYPEHVLCALDYHLCEGMPIPVRA